MDIRQDRSDRKPAGPGRSLKRRDAVRDPSRPQSEMPLGDDRGYRHDPQRSSIVGEALSCVGCHREQAKALNESGIFRQGLYNDVYVVGMSRNDDLDRVSLGFLALVLLGIVANATGHRVAYRKRSRS